MKVDELGRTLALYMDRNYDSEEGTMAKDLARFLLSRYNITSKKK